MAKKRSAYLDGWSQRLKAAVLLKAFRDKDRGISAAKIADHVSRIVKRQRPYTSQAVSLWLHGQGAPDAETQIALAEWLGVDPGWLIAGEKSAAPAPHLLAKELSIDLTAVARQHLAARAAGKGRKVGKSAARNRGYGAAVGR
jgi:transcriptional regulator with XRE-family HTH domain